MYKKYTRQFTPWCDIYPLPIDFQLFFSFVRWSSHILDSDQLSLWQETKLSRIEWKQDDTNLGVARLLRTAMTLENQASVEQIQVWSFDIIMWLVNVLVMVGKIFDLWINDLGGHAIK